MKVESLNKRLLPEPRAAAIGPPSVSVAIATFNGERYLPELLTSILKQSVLPCEIVFADDASSDQTLSIIREFGDSAPFPVTLLMQEQNVGVIHNYLAAFKYCSGEAIAYCDQDDVWLHDKIEVCANALVESAVNLVIHKSFVTDAQLNRSGRLVHHNKFTGRLKFPVNSLEIAGYGHQMVFRRSVIEALITLHEKFNESLHVIIANFDNAIPLAASFSGDLAVLSQPLVLFRRHGESVSPAEKIHAKTGIPGLVTRRFVANRQRTEQVTAFSKALEIRSSALANVMLDNGCYLKMLKNAERLGRIRLEMEAQYHFLLRVASLFKLWTFAITARPRSNYYAFRDFTADVVCAILRR